MPRNVADREPRRRLTWPPGAPAVGIHLGVGAGLLRVARRARQIGATAVQIFSDNPTQWRPRSAPPADAARFIDYTARQGIAPIAIHASYLINLAGTAEPFRSQSRALLAHELQRAPAFGASLVNTHIGSHRGSGVEGGIGTIADHVASVLAEAPPGVRLVLENSAGGGDNLGSTVEELARILEETAARQGDHAAQLAFCLDTAHLWGAGYEIDQPAEVTALIDRFGELIGLDRLALIHLNDSKSDRGGRTDRHEHVGAGRIGPIGLGALIREPRLASGTAFMLETPGVDEGYDAVNLRRAWLLFNGATELPLLPPRAFRLNRRSTRMGMPDGVRGPSRTPRAPEEGG